MAIFTNYSTFPFTRLFISLVILFGSCEQTVVSSDYNSKYFTKIFGDSSFSLYNYVLELEDQGILTVEVLPISSDYTQIQKVDKFGNLVWKKKLPEPIAYVNAIQLSNGNILINSKNSSKLIELTQDGEVVLNTYYDPSLTRLWFSKVYVAQNGLRYIGATEGSQLGFSHFIDVVSKKGELLHRYQLDEFDFFGHFLTINIHHVEDQKIWINGNAFKLPFFISLDDPIKFFTTTVDIRDTSFGVKNIMDEEIDSEMDNLIDYVITKNQHLVGLISGGWIFRNSVHKANNTFELVVLDTSSTIIWRKKFDIGVPKVLPLSLRINPNGDYIISGYCVIEGTTNSQPFVAKVNTQGELVFSKIFKMDMTGMFYNGIQNSMGEYILVGGVAGLGSRMELFEPILLKTDSKGLLQE